MIDPTLSLLVITQKVDRNDSNLGSFHEWLLRLSLQVKKLTVICLEKGSCDLPANVEVLSLGKEVGASRSKYIVNFYRYIISRRGQYDGVWVHMNQIYVILGALFWKSWKKPILLWYVHRSVSATLRLAEKLVNNIFTTSPESFRLPSHKVEYVGHGIPVELFTAVPKLSCNPLKLITTGRITESKDLETIIRSVVRLKVLLPESEILLTVVGEPIRSDDQLYFQKIQTLVQELDLGTNVIFTGKMTNTDLREVLAQQSVFINASRTGSVDKAVLEALAARLPVVTSNEAFLPLTNEGIVMTFQEGESSNLAEVIEKICHSGILTPNQKGREYVIKNHNLTVLIDRIVTYFIAATSI